MKIISTTLDARGVARLMAHVESESERAGRRQSMAGIVRQAIVEYLDRREEESHGTDQAK